MTGHEELPAVQEATQAQDEKSRLSRRTALRTAAAAGMAATALAATGAPALAGTRPARARHGAGHDEAGHGAADASEPIIAHLRNARTGEIDVFHGTTQTRLHDPALAAMLMRASR